MSLRSTVYVGNVTYSTQEADLVNLFSKYGNVLSVEIKRGYAFVKYDNVVAAASAIQNFNNYLFNGRPIRVSYSITQPNPRITSPQHNMNNNNNNNNVSNNIPNNNNQTPLSNPVQQSPPKPVQPRVPYKENAIHVANLPFTITEEQLRSYFESYGILSIHIIRTRNCFAIIELSSYENSSIAIEQQKGLNIDGRDIAVTRQIELPERYSNYRGRGSRGRGRGRGFRRGVYRRGGFVQRNDQFTLTNDLHLHNNNINNNLNTNNNSLNNNVANVNNDNSNANNDGDINNMEDNDNDNSSGHPIFHNQNYRGNYRGSGYRYSGDIFRGRGNGRGRGRGRGGYRGRGQFRARGFRGRGRGFVNNRGGINEVFSHINNSHTNTPINNPSI